MLKSNIVCTVCADRTFLRHKEFAVHAWDGAQRSHTGHQYTAMRSTQEHRLVLVAAWRELAQVCPRAAEFAQPKRRLKTLLADHV